MCSYCPYSFPVRACKEPHFVPVPEGRQAMPVHGPTNRTKKSLRPSQVVTLSQWAMETNNCSAGDSARETNECCEFKNHIRKVDFRTRSGKDMFVFLGKSEFEPLVPELELPGQSIMFTLVSCALHAWHDLPSECVWFYDHELAMLFAHRCAINRVPPWSRTNMGCLCRRIRHRITPFRWFSPNLVALSHPLSLLAF